MILISVVFYPWALFLRINTIHAHNDQYGALHLFSPFKISLFAFALAAAASFSVIVPGTGYIHYYLLLSFPLAILSIASVYCFFYWSSPSYRVLVTIIIGIGFSAMQFFPLNYKIAPKMFLHDLAMNYSSWGNDPISLSVKQYKKPGEKLVVWGWSYGYYVETGSVIGVRTSMEIICDNKFKRLNNYFVSSYAKELGSSHAPVLIDTVAPGQFYFDDRSRFGFHLYPQIATVITEMYLPVKEVEGVMIYVSKQRLEEIRKGLFLL
jgi:hypothetical protein